jgi:hypothetical protein
LEDDGTGSIHIDSETVTPPESDLTTWNWTGYIPKYGQYIKPIANELAEQTASVTHDSSSDNSFNRTNDYTVQVKYLDKSIDYPENSTYNIYESYREEDGGLTAKFDYAEYADGDESLKARGRLRYLAYVGYNIFLWTKWGHTTWTADFM